MICIASSRTNLIHSAQDAFMRGKSVVEIFRSEEVSLKLKHKSRYGRRVWDVER